MSEAWGLRCEVWFLLVFIQKGMKGIGLKIGIIFIFWGVFDILLSCFQDNLGSNMF